MKLTNMIFIIIGLQLMFFIAGLNTSMGYVLGALNLANDPAGVVGGQIYVLIIGILAAAVVAGVAIGFLTKSPVENLLVAPLASFLFVVFIGDIVSIINITNAACAVGSSCRWITWVVTLILAPLVVIFGMAIIDWWRGRD